MNRFIERGLFPQLNEMGIAPIAHQDKNEKGQVRVKQTQIVEKSEKAGAAADAAQGRGTNKR